MSKYKIADPKSWRDPIKDRKESRSLYLAREDWEYLIKEGDGKPSITVRALIAEKRTQST